MVKYSNKNYSATCPWFQQHNEAVRTALLNSGQTTMLGEGSVSDVLWAKLILIFLSTHFPNLFHPYGLKGDPSFSVYQEITNYFMSLVCEKSSAKEWLLTNWKSFRNYASYNHLTSCWSSFDGVRNHFGNGASFSCFAQ